MSATFSYGYFSDMVVTNMDLKGVTYDNMPDQTTWLRQAPVSPALIVDTFIFIILMQLKKVNKRIELL